MLISHDLPVILSILWEIRIQHEKCDFPGHSEYLKRSNISKDTLFRVLYIILHIFNLNFYRKIHKFAPEKVRLAEKFFRRGIPMRIL